MHDLRGHLYRAIDMTLLSRLEDETHEDVVETLLDAVLEVLCATHTVDEWGLRCIASKPDCWHNHKPRDDRVVWSAEHRSDLEPLPGGADMYELVFRRGSPWERVTD